MSHSATAHHDRSPVPARAAWLHPVRTLLRNDEWIHTLLGLVGNLAFVAGSVCFLFDDPRTAGVWLVIVGSLGMLVGSVGRAIVDREFGTGRPPDDPDRRRDRWRDRPPGTRVGGRVSAGWRRRRAGRPGRSSGRRSAP